MRHLLKRTFVFLTAVATTIAFATPIPNTTSNPTTFLGPIAQLGVTKPVSDNTAVSALGEAGPKNFRLGGTVGWDLTYYQRLKVSAEWLRQQITYSFFDGRESPWLNQGAIGADYQYDFHDRVPYNTQLDLGIYYSHAPSTNLGTSTGSYLNSAGIPQFYTDNKRIAGSNAAGVSPAVTIWPLEGTGLTFALNYDNVRYDTVNSPSQNAIGLGGTIGLHQAITQDIALGLSGAVRQPFNNYQADISWGNVPYHGTWVFSLFGAYTVGKNTLPTTYNVGLGANYLMDAHETAPAPRARTVPLPMYKDAPVGYKGEEAWPLAMPTEWEDNSPGNKALTAWTSVPAVYMPQVLAVTDENVSICTPLTFTGTIPDLTGENQTVDLTQYFGGQGGVTYTVTTPGVANASGYTISGANLSFTNTINYPVVLVTAHNACGSATSNAFEFFVD